MYVYVIAMYCTLLTHEVNHGFRKGALLICSIKKSTFKP